MELRAAYLANRHVARTPRPIPRCRRIRRNANRGTRKSGSEGRVAKAENAWNPAYCRVEPVRQGLIAPGGSECFQLHERWLKRSCASTRLRPERSNAKRFLQTSLNQRLRQQQPYASPPFSFLKF